MIRLRLMRYMLLTSCLLVGGCAILEPHRGEDHAPGELIRIGTIGDKRYQIKGLSVRIAHSVCDEKAYVASFRNGLVNRWDTNAMLDRLPKRYFLDVPPENLRGFFTVQNNKQCVLESIAVGEADGDRAGKKLYGEFLQKTNAR